eukprot:366028-Chlamydomonas_euryale.AAC.19
MPAGAADDGFSKAAASCEASPAAAQPPVAVLASVPNTNERELVFALAARCNEAVAVRPRNEFAPASVGASPGAFVKSLPKAVIREDKSVPVIKGNGTDADGPSCAGGGPTEL